MREISPKKLQKINDNSFKDTQKIFRRRLREIAAGGEKKARYKPDDYYCGERIADWLKSLGFTVKQINPLWYEITWPEEEDICEKLRREGMKILTQSMPAKVHYAFGWLNSEKKKKAATLGVWEMDTIQWDYVCSACGKHSEYKTDFCCNCGKKMKGDKRQMYKAYITILTNVRKHPNADRLLLADVFGNTVCVSTDYTEGQLGIYFPTDGQLSVEFAEKNNLVRKKDDAGNNVGGYMDPDKRNVTAIRLRGEKSDGLFLPISALNYCYAHGDASIELRAGDVIDGLVNGHEICCKYIPRSNTRRGTVTEGNRTRKKKVATAPLFKEHADTEQLAYNLGAFKPGDEIEITLKMHGTSQRTGYLPVLQGYKRTLLDRILRREGTPIYDYGYVSGTRRVVLENYEGGFYGDNEFREQHSKIFEGKLWKGETVYYEVVGFTTTGAPIMGDASNKKLNDKEFIKQYGETTRFSYGCSETGGPDIDAREDENGYLPRLPMSDIYVYRMTMTNPDGEVVEYTPDFMRYRCEQMAVKTVPVFWKGMIEGKRIENGEITPGEWIKNIAEGFYDGPDPVGKTHVREGVVVRIINRPKFAAYKHKNFSFKVLSNIAVADAEAKGTIEGMSEDILAEM